MAESHDRRFDELDAGTLYALLALRTEVFIVEQASIYPELDGRDLEPTTRHVWIDGDDGPMAYLRVLAEDGGHRIGRVVTEPASRGQGLAARLVAHVADTTPGTLTLHAQAHLADWYAGQGYAVTGGEFDDGDGIPHVPMTFER